MDGVMAWLTILLWHGRDFEKAFPLSWVSQRHSTLGKTLLGRMHYEGQGVEQDMGKAEQYLQEAVDQGHSEASGMLDKIKSVQK